jgi:hypothetical protein
VSATVSASEAVLQAAGDVMVHWANKRLGGSKADDAAVLRHLNSLDAIAADLAEIESHCQRPAAAGSR